MLALSSVVDRIESLRSVLSRSHEMNHWLSVAGVKTEIVCEELTISLVEPCLRSSEKNVAHVPIPRVDVLSFRHVSSREKTVLPTNRSNMDPRPLILIDTGIIGGPGRGIIQLVTFLVSRGADYFICSFAYRKPMSQEFVEELRHRNLKAGTISQRLLFDPTPLWQFFRLVKHGRYNIIQSHGYKSHFIALVVSRLLRIPWVAFAHGWTSETRKVALYHSLDTWMLRFAEVVIAVSPPLVAHFSKVRGHHRPTRLILNAVDRESLRGKIGGSAIRERYSHNSSRILIGCFGRLSFEKGQDVLLRAMVEVVNGNHDVLVLFLGDGPEQEALQSLSRELGLAEKVLFHQHTSAMRDYYEAIDILVVPSRSEGLPNVLLEALCFGIPVIATDVGAVREVITDGKTGWIVPAGDTRALGSTIAAVISNKGARDRVSKAGRRLVDEKFSPTTRGQLILDVYRTLAD